MPLDAQILDFTAFFIKNTASLYRLPLLYPAKPIVFCGNNFLPLLLRFRPKRHIVCRFGRLLRLTALFLPIFNLPHFYRTVGKLSYHFLCIINLR